MPAEQPPPEIDAALLRASELSGLLSRLTPTKFAFSRRSALSMAYFGLAMEHHLSLAMLAQHGRYSSAYALLRPLYEAAYRGWWTAFFATDEQLANLEAGRAPKFETVIKALNKGGPGVAPGQFAATHSMGWESFCDYTHGGMRQLSRWFDLNKIGQRHPPSEVAQVLALADQLACLAAGGAIQLAGEDLTPLHNYLTGASSSKA